MRSLRAPLVPISMHSVIGLTPPAFSANWDPARPPLDRQPTRSLFPSGPHRRSRVSPSTPNYHSKKGVTLMNAPIQHDPSAAETNIAGT